MPRLHRLCEALGARMLSKLLVVLLVAEKACPGRAQCSSDGLELSLDRWQASLPIPSLEEGRMVQRPCGEFFEGYLGFIEVYCLAGKLMADTLRCTPSGCPAGAKVTARISTFNTTVLVEAPKALAHGDEAFVPCGLAIDKFMGVNDTWRLKYRDQVRLQCKLGKLQVDTSSCREAFNPMAVPSVWRIVNGDYLPGTWRVFELAFYEYPDCQGGKLEGGTIIASSEGLENGALKQLAFDRNLDTNWSPRCELGCRKDTAWIGIDFQRITSHVRCVQLRQSQVKCCGSRHVRLEVWDGAAWQSSQVWDTEGMERDPHSFLLKVPQSCEGGKPEGDGIVHDCDGPPVVGRQAGEVCHAECQEGYYGGREKFTCGQDGNFVGDTPTCYNLDGLTRIAGLVCVVGGALFLAWQYKFWCMYKKVRLTAETNMIPTSMKGRWLEQDGQNIWDLLASEKKKDKDQSLGEMIGAVMLEKDGDAEQQKAQLDHQKMIHSRGGRPVDQMFAEVNQMVTMRTGQPVGREKPPSLHGLCDPCEDPDLCWTCIVCPICRIADTWHTLGMPAFLTYGKVILAYLLCPLCWPCFNFLGRLRVRQTFEIPLEPHRDCMVHCCCCCICSPCGICQEARLVDAPTRIHWSRKAQASAQEMLWRDA